MPILEDPDFEHNEFLRKKVGTERRKMKKNMRLTYRDSNPQTLKIGRPKLKPLSLNAAKVWLIRPGPAICFLDECVGHLKVGQLSFDKMSFGEMARNPEKWEHPIRHNSVGSWLKRLIITFAYIILR